MNDFIKLLLAVVSSIAVIAILIGIPIYVFTNQDLYNSNCVGIDCILVKIIASFLYIILLPFLLVQGMFEFFGYNPQEHIIAVVILGFFLLFIFIFLASFVMTIIKEKDY